MLHSASRLGAPQESKQLAEGLAAMGNRKLFLSREFCKGLCKRWIKEVRIVTEPARSPRLVYDRTIGAPLEDRENLALPRKRNGANVVGGAMRRGRSETCPYTPSRSAA